MPPAQVIMAHLFFQANMPKEAQSALEQAAIDDPTDPETYLLMASVAMHDHDVAKAESLIQKAKGLLATFTKSVKRKERLQPQVLSGLAGVAEARGDWAGAQKALEEWLKLDAKNVGAMQRVAYCLLQQKNAEAPWRSSARRPRPTPSLLPAETMLAQFCQRSGDRENAEKWMAAALAAAPKDIRTRLAASQWALDRGKLDEAHQTGGGGGPDRPEIVRRQGAPGHDCRFREELPGGGVVFRLGVQRRRTTWPSATTSPWC